MPDKNTKDKVETVKATAKALSDTDQRIDGDTVGKVIAEQVKQQHS
jgi:hypothetical protein